MEKFILKSNHHVVGKEDDASLVSLVMIDSLVYPLFVLTMQDKKHIVKQVNAYSLNTHDVSDDNMNDDMEIVSDYFLNMGDKNIKHAVADETGNLSYCKNCLKINGFVF